MRRSVTSGSDGPAKTGGYRLVPQETPAQARRAIQRRPLRQRPVACTVLAVLAVFLLLASWSVGNALTVPGGGTVSERLAEWARDHYLGPLVTFGEWLSYQSPKVGGKPSFSLARPGIRGAAAPRGHATRASSAPPAPLRSLAGRPLRGEGRWRVLGTVGGEPAIYGTYLRASSVYSSYVAGIVLLNQNLLRFELRRSCLSASCISS